MKIKPEHLRAIADNDDWTLDEDGDWTCPGEPADGVPQWDVLVYSHGYTLIRELGIYEQRWGDITDPADIPRYARAMDAACDARAASLRGDDR